MRLAKVNAGHWKDGDSGPGFSRRYQFAEDCLEAGKVAISFLHTGGHPFTPHLSTDVIMHWSKEEIKEMYLEKGHSSSEAGNTASQLVRFRDWPTGTPVFLYLGRNKVYRVGYLKGEYEYEWDGHFGPESEYNHPHVREVEWANVPELFSRKELPDGLQGWISNPQAAIDYDVEPGSNVADFLALSFGIGSALSNVSEAERKVLR
jgi:hypothetical protein